ncbi:MAG: hypothetical protein AABW48_02190 [Nanoarchaeota archaeon]
MATLPKIAAAAGLVSLEVLLSGCAEEFPQYSGKYKLTSYSYTAPEFKGEQQPAAEINLTDRMEHSGGIWIHYLKLEFEGSGANGSLVLQLNDLTRINQDVWPNNSFNGDNLFNEKKVYGTGAFCNYQYQYFLFLESNPSAEILKEVYPGQGKFLGNDPITKMPLYESLTKDAANVELNEAAAEKWQDIIDDNEGIILKFTFTRHLKSEMPGWENGSEDCTLPYGPRGEESLTFIYQSTEEDTATDIRGAGVNELFQEIDSTEAFFTKLISGIKF